MKTFSYGMVIESSAVKFLINDEVWVGGQVLWKKAIWGSRVKLLLSLRKIFKLVQGEI